MGSRLLIVDIDFAERAKMKAALANTPFEVVGEASTGDQALEQCNKVWPDIVVISADTPMSYEATTSGLNAIYRLLGLSSAPRIVVTFTQELMHSVTTALRDGAAAGLDKNFSRRDVLEALKKAEVYKPGLDPMRRRRVRIETQIVALFKKQKDGIFKRMRTAVVDNISGGGLGIHAAEELEQGTELKLRLKVPDGMKPLSLRAKVAWCNSAPGQATAFGCGLGLEFVDLSGIDQERIDAYVEKLLAGA